MIQKKLIEKFGNHINHMSCIYLNDGEKHLRSFLEELAPLDTVIEIGTFQGVSACIISEYAKKVMTFDIEKQPLTESIVDFACESKIDLIVGKPSMISAGVKESFEKEKIDLAFIDGEHFDGQLKKDFELVKDCKQILIHDYDPGFPEVYEFCNEITGYKKDVRGSFILLTRECETPEKPKGKKRGRKKRL